MYTKIELFYYFDRLNLPWDFPKCKNIKIHSKFNKNKIEKNVIRELYFNDVFDKTAYQINEKAKDKKWVRENLLKKYIDIENIKKGDIVYIKELGIKLEVVVIFDGYIEFCEPLYLEYMDKKCQEEKEMEKLRKEENKDSLPF